MSNVLLGVLLAVGAVLYMRPTSGLGCVTPVGADTGSKPSPKKGETAKKPRLLAVCWDCGSPEYEQGKALEIKTRIKTMGEPIQLRYLEVRLEQEWMEFDGVRDLDFFPQREFHDSVRIPGPISISQDGWESAFSLRYPRGTIAHYRAEQWQVSLVLRIEGEEREQRFGYVLAQH